MKNKLVINYRAVTFILMGLTVGLGLDSLAHYALEVHQNSRYFLDKSISVFVAYFGGGFVFLMGTVNSFFWINWIIEVIQQFLKYRQCDLYWKGVCLWFGSLVTLLGLMILSSLHLLTYLSWGYTVLIFIGLGAILVNSLTFLILLFLLSFNSDWFH